MSRREGATLLSSGAIVDVEFGGAARQARVALQVELAGGIVAAVAGDAAVVEDRLNAGGVVVDRRSRLRIGASNAAGQGKDHQAIQAQTKHGTTCDQRPIQPALSPSSVLCHRGLPSFITPGTVAARDRERAEEESDLEGPENWNGVADVVDSTGPFAVFFQSDF